MRFAKENPGLIMQLEKRWCEFIVDRSTPSCQLKPMPRPLRTMIHHYSDLWRIHTESFDPEPRRYINCVKMRDTKVPKLLLSSPPSPMQVCTRATAFRDSMAFVQTVFASRISPRRLEDLY